jgi:hypothetical protein
VLMVKELGGHCGGEEIRHQHKQGSSVEFSSSQNAVKGGSHLPDPPRGRGREIRSFQSDREEIRDVERLRNSSVSYGGSQVRQTLPILTP